MHNCGEGMALGVVARPTFVKYADQSNHQFLTLGPFTGAIWIALPYSLREY